MLNIDRTLSLVAKSVFIGLFAFLFFKIIHTASSFSDNVVIATIGAVSVFGTIFGSILVAQKTSSSNARMQRDMEARKLKQEYYHRFLDALSAKFSHLKDMTTADAILANKKFCIEVNRLPLYASQKVVEIINEFAGTGIAPEFSELYSLVRADLCSGSYSEFSQLKQIHFQIPDHV